MEHGFYITCKQCGSTMVTVDTVDNGEYIEVKFICDECGQED